MSKFLIVKCQQQRARNLQDRNGSRFLKKNADCLRLLGRISDIDAGALNQKIRNILERFREGSTSLETAQRFMASLFCDTFKASYYCPGCAAFMDVKYTAPGYEVEGLPRDEADFSKTMRPKVKTRQREIA
jgi:hypothetical protein